MLNNDAKKEEVYKLLDSLDIKYEVQNHDKIYTVEESEKINWVIEGLHCKNLFLKDNKKNYYIYYLPQSKKTELKELSKSINVSKLSFASHENLMEILCLEPGSVTPLGIINDKDIKVTIIFDNEVVGKTTLCHPNSNDASIKIDYEDLIKIIEHTSHKYIVI